MDARIGAVCAEAASKASAQLLSSEQMVVAQFRSEMQVKQHVLSLVEISPGIPVVQVQSRIEKLLRLLDPISLSFGEMTFGSCTPARFLWGIFGAVIDLVRRDFEALDFTLKMFDELLATLPRKKSYTIFITESPDLQLAISDFYQEFIRLGVRAVKAFGRGKIGILTRLKWKRDQKEFQLALRHLKQTKEKVELEVGIANSEQMERRYQEIMTGRMHQSEARSLSTSSESFDLSQKIFSVPYPRNRRFYGRDTLLSEIHGQLSPKLDSEPNTRFVALCGLGGSGKTQVALEYMYKHRNDYEACLWISCDTPIKASQGFVEVARKLGIEDVQQNHLRALIKDWLCDTCKSWLMIFDNAEDRRIIADLWPPAAHGSVLLTSQNESWLSAESLTHGIRVDSFSLDDGVGMLHGLLANQGRSIGDEAAKGIVKAVGALPLAIFQIGSYLIATHSSPKDFLDRYLNPSTAVHVDSWDEAMPSTYQHTLATVWKLGFDNLPSSSILLLSIMALLDSDRIPVALFQPGPPAMQPDETVEIEEAMRYLRRYSFVTHVSGEETAQIFSVHRQVQRYTRSRLDSMAFERCLKIIVKLLRYQFPQRSVLDEPFDPFNQMWQRADSWISHLESLSNAVDGFKGKIEIPTAYISMLLDGAIYLWERGFLKQGSEIIEAAKSLCAGQEPRLLKEEIHCFYACFLSDMGRIDEAEPHFQQLVAAKRQTLLERRQSGAKASMEDEIRLANAYNNHAGVQCAQGHYYEAELHNILSLKLKHRWTTEANLDSLLSLSYSNLGNLYGRQGNWETSAQNFEKALTLGESTDSTLRQALTLHNYGCMRLAEHRVEDARDLLTRAFQIRTGKLGDHYETAGTLHMLASCYCDLGEFENARDLLQEGLRMLEASRDRRDLSRIARSKYKLAQVLHELHDPSASNLRQQAIELENPVSERDMSDEDVYDDLVAYT